MTDPMPPSARVTVVDFDMPFGALVMFLIKLAFAAIPAYLIMMVIFLAVFGLFGGVAALLGTMATR